jgi:membrane protein required for colicin V production
VTWEDWAIVIVLCFSAIHGLARGFFRTACSLIGFLLGFALAAWNYAKVASLLQPLVRENIVADVLAFLLIAALVGVVSSMVGSSLSKAFHLLGLGCIDKLGGALLGLVKGAALVTLAILATITFFPDANWLQASRLPRHFFAACRLSASYLDVEELSKRVKSGLERFEQYSHIGYFPASEHCEKMC